MWSESLLRWPCIGLSENSQTPSGPLSGCLVRLEVTYSKGKPVRAFGPFSPASGSVS
jgi:hypothetical protein